MKGFVMAPLVVQLSHGVKECITVIGVDRGRRLDATLRRSEAFAKPLWKGGSAHATARHLR
jgi:hypothetical protein